MENVSRSLEDIVSYIKNTDEYKKCLVLKEKMSSNEEIQSLIKEVKDTQKKYVRNHYDSQLKEQLDSLEKRLGEIPIYVVYLENLSKVNEMISYVKDSLNDYFTDLFQ